MIDRRRQHDYIPSNAAQFREFMRHLLEYINSHKTAWAHIPQAVLDELWILYDAYNDAFELTIGQHTPAQTLDRNEKQAAATKGLRALTNQWGCLISPLASNSHHFTKWRWRSRVHLVFAL